ncbi:MAG: STAS domain-containing protein [Actinomycetota bacterium]
MDIQRSDGKDEVVFVLGGRMTFKDNELFRPVFNEVSTGTGRSIVLDLGKLEFVDSYAIGLFLIAIDEARRCHNTFRVRNPQGAVQRVFKLANLDAVLTVEAPSADAAPATQPAVAPTRRPIRNGLAVSPLRDHGDGTAAVSLAGRFTFADHDTFERFVEALNEGRFRHISVDLSELEFMDSAGLSMLLIARDELAKRNADMELVSPSGRVAQLLHLAAVDTLVHVSGDA